MALGTAAAARIVSKSARSEGRTQLFGAQIDAIRRFFFVLTLLRASQFSAQKRIVCDTPQLRIGGISASSGRPGCPAWPPRRPEAAMGPMRRREAAGTPAKVIPTGEKLIMQQGKLLTFFSEKIPILS